MTADLLLRGGTVVDGSGSPPGTADVAIIDGRVHLPQPGAAPAAARVVDASRKIVCPGFIDLHTHSDWVVLVDPWLEASLRQGVTTVVTGNCGQSPAPAPHRTSLRSAAVARWGAAQATALPPLADEIGWTSVGDYLACVADRGPATNVAALVGFGRIRRTVMGRATRPATADERATMRQGLALALEEGAFGMSTGLIYEPDRHADIAELADVSTPLRDAGGLYASHIRGEGAMVWEALGEAVGVGRRAGCRVQVSHLKLEGAEVWGRAQRLLDTLHRAREDGVDVGGDQYPYDAYETSLSSFLPPGRHDAPTAAAHGEPAALAALTAEVEHGTPGWQSSVAGVGWHRITVVTHEDAIVRGRTIAELARRQGRTPVQIVLDLLAADARAGVVGHAMHEQDVRAILTDPDVAVASDGVAWPRSGPLAAMPTHPRSFGTFPRVLGRYVRDLDVLALATAIRKMTALPADRLGLSDRGRLVEGAVADLVVLDPARIADHATYARPRLPPTGIELVVVGGRVALEGDRLVGRHGRVLAR